MAARVAYESLAKDRIVEEQKYLSARRYSSPLQARWSVAEGEVRDFFPDSKTEIHPDYTCLSLDMENVKKWKVEKSIQESSAASLFRFFFMSTKYWLQWWQADTCWYQPCKLVIKHAKVTGFL